MKRKLENTYFDINKKVKLTNLTTEEIILQIEYGMASKQMLSECKLIYKNKKNKNKKIIEFLKLYKNKKNVDDYMNLYKLVYSIEKK